MTTSHDDAPILMVRTISDYDVQRRIPQTADVLKLALGERAALFVSASGQRQLSTALYLRQRLNELGPGMSYSHDMSFSDVLDETQYSSNGIAPVKKYLTESALRGVWTPGSNTGLVMVTSEYPIIAAARSQQEALGVPFHDQKVEIEPGEVFELNPDLIGYSFPTQDEIFAFQNPVPEVPPQAPSSWLDFFRRKPHN